LSEIKGTFIISLDCEGKWGMADQIGPFHNRFITHDRLIDAYQTLIRLFDRYNVPATFAFVMAFILDEARRRHFRHYFCDDVVDGQNWLRHYRNAEAAGNLDGWFCPEALNIVRRSGRHEIAAHGFSHVPLAEGITSRLVAAREMRACLAVAENLEVAVTTFVYPRNQIGHVDLLAESGFRGFREAPLKPRWLTGKAASLISELDVFSKAEKPLPSHRSGIARIPGGQMVNWQHGLRRAIPGPISTCKWASIVADAAKNGKVAHLWLHPHNILTAPKTLDRVEAVLKQVAYWRAKQMIEVVTQAQFIDAQTECRPDRI
jgi:peptidoglycan/xylan/chitin deacetylase (PgdA/CDA1 family)